MFPTFIAFLLLAYIIYTFVLESAILNITAKLTKVFFYNTGFFDPEYKIETPNKNISECVVTFRNILGVRVVLRNCLYRSHSDSYGGLFDCSKRIFNDQNDAQEYIDLVNPQAVTA